MIKIIKLKTLIISSLCLFISTINLPYCFSQIFSIEQNPPSIKWSQINSSNFQIIFPKELNDEAQRMANTLEHIIGGVSKSLNIKPRKISIILQNQSVVSNGFVQLAPRRSEFFTTAPQNFDFQDWLNSLAIHELRHVVQIDKLNPKLKAPFFEELALAIFGISLPPWFYEGDAVVIETALSHAGRGRLPEWELFIKSNTLSGKNYSYSKNYFGSLKDRTPGYYQLGYFMTSKLRRDYGEKIMDSILTRVSNNPLRPFNLSNSIKKYTGMNSKDLHDETIKELRELWEKQSDQIQALSYPILNKRKDSLPTDYLLSIRISGNKILALKHSLTETPAIVLINENGREKTIKKIGYQTEPNFNYAAGKIVWDELRFDKRYFKRSYNVINILDLESGSYKQITHKSRFFSPTLSNDGKRIAAIMIKENNKSLLVELNSENGNIIEEYDQNIGTGLQMPYYNNTNNKIICSITSNDGSALIEFNLKEKNYRLLIPFDKQQIFRPIYAENSIVFRAHYNGVNNIYNLDTVSKKITAISNVKLGASYPSYNSDKKEIMFSNYKYLGYDISSTSYKTDGPEISTLKNSFINYAAPIVDQESNSSILDNVPSKKFEIKPYKEINNLFYFHSLSPIAEDNDGDSKIGLKLKSNNKLNTLDFYTGYQFNSTLRTNEYLAGLSYKRYYPIFNLNYTNRFQLITVKQNNQLSQINWRENFVEMGVNIPFTFNRLNKTFQMGFLGSSSFTSRYNIQDRPTNFIDKLKFPMKYTIYFSRNTQRSARDLAPKWGQNIVLSYFHLPFENRLKGRLFAFMSNLYSPGLIKNHSFQVSFNYQNSDGAYAFNVEIPRISGYNNLNTSGKLSNTLLLDYKLPLWYPDAEIGPFAYIKRIKGGIFSDFENIGKNSALHARSFGIELSADMNLMRFLLPIFELKTKMIFSDKVIQKNPIFELGFSYNLQ